MRLIFLGILLVSLLLTSCEEKQENNIPQLNHSDEMNKEAHVATVKEKVDAGSYSYLNVSEDRKTYWIAVPKSDVTPGEEIYFSQFMEMKNFRSETLDKTFESVLFVEDARRNNQNDITNPHKTELGSIPKESVTTKKAEGGYTIEELYAKKDKLVNKIVKVRGKVVKSNLGIMNRNWFHIQDGTGTEGSHDLTLTSNDAAQVGDEILVEGTFGIDKNFGSGYFYPIILENSKISKK